LGTTSGIHASHAEYFIRRVRIDVSNPVALHLKSVLPPEFIELDAFNSSNYVVSIPMKAVKSISRNSETALQLLERVKYINETWIAESHRSGINKHNVSVTVSYRPEEEQEIKEWMWNNRESYTGISLLPHSDHTYTQAPFEEISKEQYENLYKKLPQVNLTNVKFTVTANDEREAELACVGGSCEFK
jgi:ribonucleoside-diphosphate reductase alpha chain